MFNGDVLAENPQNNAAKECFMLLRKRVWDVMRDDFLAVSSSRFSPTTT